MAFEEQQMTHRSSHLWKGIVRGKYLYDQILSFDTFTNNWGLIEEQGRCEWSHLKNSVDRRMFVSSDFLTLKTDALLINFKNSIGREEIITFEEEMITFGEEKITSEEQHWWEDDQKRHRSCFGQWQHLSLCSEGWSQWWSIL